MLVSPSAGFKAIRNPNPTRTAFLAATLALGFSTGCREGDGPTHAPEAKVLTGAEKRFDWETAAGRPEAPTAGALAPLRAWTEEADGRSRKVFAFEVPAEGSYRVGAWIDGLPGEAFRLRVDGGEAVARLAHSEGGWQSLVAEDALALTRGSHTLSIEGTGNDAPRAETMVLGASAEQVRIRGDRYAGFVQGLREQGLESRKTPLVKTAAAWVPKPSGDARIGYQYGLNQPVKYTWNGELSLTAGTKVTFKTTSPSSGCDPVLHLFSKGSPMTYSWTDDDGGGHPNSSLTVTIPVTGTYVLLARAYSNLTPGTVNITRNGAAYASACAIAGVRVPMGTTTPAGTLNYFTANAGSGVDTRIWLLNATNGNVVAFNDDYAGTGDFTWGDLSRLKGGFGNIGNLLLTAYSSANPAGTADVYGKAPVTGLTSELPNLKPDDGIKSSLDTWDYNCFAWAGGVTSYWWDPYDNTTGNPWYVAGNALQSVRNFYGNKSASGANYPRFTGSGAWTYSYYSGDPYQGVVAIWHNAIQDYPYQHASVTRPGNGIPHGYAWESKFGSGERFFHPRDALVESGYSGFGSIQGYFKWTGTTMKTSAAGTPEPVIMTEAESIRQGLSVLQAPLAFDAGEKQKLAAGAASLTPEKRQTFARLLQTWKLTFAAPALSRTSIAGAFARGPAYSRFATFCATEGKAVWPLLFEELEKAHPLTGHGIVKLLLPGREPLLSSIGLEWARNPYRDDGKYQIFSPGNARMRFAKALVAEM